MKASENKRILVLLIFLIILLLAPIVYLTYFTIFKAQDAIKNPANKRPMMAENAVKRGNIYDRDGNVLAYSTGEKFQYQRVYNYPVIYSHIVGYSNKIVSKYGIEKEYNSYLLGKEGSKLLKTFKSIFNKKLDLNMGDSLILTTNTELQKKTRSVLGENNEKGSVVIMNPKNGEILSMVSLPDFNSQNIAQDNVSHESSNAFLKMPLPYDREVGNIHGDPRQTPDVHKNRFYVYSSPLSASLPLRQPDLRGELKNLSLLSLRFLRYERTRRLRNAPHKQSPQIAIP